MSLEKDETTPESGTQDGVSTLSVLLTLSFCAGRQDLALPLASFWLRLYRAVLINVQRTTVERGYVSVIVTSDLVTEDGHLDMDGVSAKAREMGQSPAVRWYLEERQVQIHPLQRPPEPDEEVYMGPLGRPHSLQYPES